MRTRSSTSLLALALALALALVGACSDDTPPGSDSCSSDADCAAGAICADGACAACDSDAQCAPGLRCDEGACTNSCAASSDCAEGALCAEGACAACADDASCAADARYGDGFACTEGACTERVCLDGTLECPCDEGSCSQGECVKGTCSDCTRGEIGCVCRLNGSCAEGAVCGDGDLCVACTEGVEFCPCDAAGGCGDGLVCAGGTCVADPCTPGALDCPCDEGACADAETYCDDSNLCRLCMSDVAGCACEDGACQGDLYCDEAADRTCATCPEADKPAGCPCLEDAECADGSACDAESSACREAYDCVSAGCDPNQDCDDSRELARDAICLPSCAMGFVWNAADGTCDPGPNETCIDPTGSLTPQGQACADAGKECIIDPFTTAVVCVDSCTALTCVDEDRECVPSPSRTQDSACGACRPGFVDGVDANGDPICEPAPLADCSPNSPDSILAQCELRHQECVVTVDGAECGGCQSGRAFNPDTNACEELQSCGTNVCDTSEFCDYPEAGDSPTCVTRCPAGLTLDDTGACVGCAVSCASGELFGRQIDGQCYCEEEVFCDYQSDGTDSRCGPNACSAGEAALDGGACTACNIACGDDSGERSRVWPRRNNSGNCFCETQNGWYTPFGGTATPQKCDQDGDGWINETAEATYAAALASGDVGILSNFRCDRRTIDRIELVNEYGQRRQMGVCGGELLDWAPGNEPAACAGGPERVVLFEKDTLDDDNAMAIDDTSFPLYGARKLRAGEVNTLTKACVSTSADYNMNGLEDLQELQPVDKLEIGAQATDADLLFRASAHFVELHRNRYVPPATPGEPGVYVIEERRRCDDAFPPTYSVGRDLYWEGCTRRRDASWNEASANARVGLDFGKQSCSDTATGTCALEAPVTTGANLDGDRVVDHDLCALDAAGMLPLANEPWRGMNHSSQFRCMQVSAGAEAFKVSRAELSSVATPNAPLDFNACVATSCDGAPNCVETLSQGDIAQPGDPVVTCAYNEGRQALVPDDAVGLVSVKFANAGSPYSRGCIDEASIHDTIASSTNPVEAGRSWSRLCDGFLENPEGFLTTGNRGDFGKLVCSCGEQFAGESCEFACAVRQTGDHGALHRGGRGAQYDATTQALYGCNPEDGYCSLVPPDPQSGFSGGRQGFWMCGEFTATRAVDGNPLHSATLDESGVDVDAVWTGAVRTSATVVRTPMTADPAECTTNPERCFTLF